MCISTHGKATLQATPLTVICSELLQQIEFVRKEKDSDGNPIDESKIKEVTNNLKEKFGICLQIGALVSLVYGDSASTSELATASSIIQATPDIPTKTKPKELVEAIQKTQIEAVQAMKDIKKHITFLSEVINEVYKLKNPIVILIDELDRCRPTYAIEVLETIKHFFDTEGCTFLIATNTHALESSIQSVYGSRFDAKHYLRRFFDRKISLPPVSIIDYLKMKELDFEKYIDNGIHLPPFSRKSDIHLELFAALFEANGVELRDVEQILSRFFTSLEYALRAKKTPFMSINTVVLMVGLIEQHFDKPELAKRQNDYPLETMLPTANVHLVHATIKAMFDTVTITNSSEQFLGNSEAINHLSPIEMLRIESYNFDSIKLFRTPSHENIAIIQDIIRQRDDTACNFWLWENYQKIIELSGHIE